MQNGARASIDAEITEPRRSAKWTVSVLKSLRNFIKHCVEWLVETLPVYSTSPPQDPDTGAS